MAFCTQCGNRLSEGSQFCSQCGAPVAQPEVSPQIPVQSQQPEKPENMHTVPPQPRQTGNQENVHTAASSQPQQTEKQENVYSVPPKPNVQPQNLNTGNQPGAQNQTTSDAGSQQGQQNAYQQAPKETNPPSQSINWGEDHTASFDPADVQNNKVMAILAYIGIFVLIPIFGAKESKFARFHSNQGLVNSLGLVIFGFMNLIMQSIWRVSSWSWSITPIYTINSVIFTVINIVFGIISLVFVALAVYGIVNAATGKARELPVIGRIKLLK